MAFTYANATRDAMLNALADLLNGGKLEIGTAGMAATLVTFTLSTPSETSISNGTFTLAGFPQTVAAAGTGTAAAARFRTSADADVITGLTVGISGADITIDNTSIVSGQNVSIADAVVIKSYGVA